MRALSDHPPAKPAMDPMMAPMRMAMPTTTGPMGIEMRAP